MLTAKQVGPLLGLSASQVHALVRAKAIAYYDFVGSIRFDPADVESYKRAATPPPQPLPDPRVARTLKRMKEERLRLDGMESAPMPLEWQAMANERVRNLRRPPWADAEKIASLYAEARRLTTETGVQHHVDHEIPLLGNLVSGLHVETNLRVIPWRDNILKSNRFDGDAQC